MLTGSPARGSLIFAMNIEDIGNIMQALSKAQDEHKRGVTHNEVAKHSKFTASYVRKCLAGLSKTSRVLAERKPDGVRYYAGSRK